MIQQRGAFTKSTSGSYVTNIASGKMEQEMVATISNPARVKGEGPREGLVILDGVVKVIRRGDPHTFGLLSISPRHGQTHVLLMDSVEWIRLYPTVCIGHGAKDLQGRTAPSEKQDGMSYTEMTRERGYLNGKPLGLEAVWVSEKSNAFGEFHCISSKGCSQGPIGAWLDAASVDSLGLKSSQLEPVTA